MKVLVLCLLILKMFESDGAKFVQFLITQGELSTGELRCVLKSLTTPHTAFGVSNGTGECMLLDQSLNANKTYCSGYTYLEKGIEINQTSDSVEPVDETVDEQETRLGVANPLDPNERIVTLPGRSEIGVRLEIYFTVRANLKSLRFRFFDLPAGSSFTVDDDFSGLILVSIQISKPNDAVLFKSYSDDWAQVPEWAPYPFQDDQTYGITIVAQQEGFQILFDGIERALLPFVGPPEEMETLLLRNFPIDSAIVHNITYYTL